MRYVISTLAAICLTLAALPAAAQSTGAGSLRGQIPEVLRVSGAVVVLQDAAGHEIARAPVSTDGRFVFAAVPAGRYTVVLVDSTGTATLAKMPARAVSGAVTSVAFRRGAATGAADPGATASVLQDAADVGLPTALPFTSGRDRGDRWGSGGDYNEGSWWCRHRCCWRSCHR
jgi:hypothetical protein